MRYFSRHGGWSRHVQKAYRSGLEETVAEELKNAGMEYQYERHHIDYSIPASLHHYTPDFVLANGIIVETKGLFDATDRRKHLLIKKQHPDLDIRFVFSNPNTKLYKGSKTTYAEWCYKNGFRYATKVIPLSWLKERKKKLKDTDIYERESKVKT